MAVEKNIDYIASLETLISCDDCELIKKLGNLEIELMPEINCFEEINYPDWYGYKRIDNILKF